MKSIREAQSKLTWIHPDPAKRSFELRSGNDVVAELEWGSEEGTLATATAAEGTWTFKRGGFFNPYVTVRQSGSNDELACFEPSRAGNGTIRFSDGREFHWKSNFWLSEWSWLNTAEDEIVRFRRDFAIDKREGVVDISVDPAGLPQLSLLCLLGWYVIILMANEAP